jgi:hypothetical protein
MKQENPSHEALVSSFAPILFDERFYERDLNFILPLDPNLSISLSMANDALENKGNSYSLKDQMNITKHVIRMGVDVLLSELKEDQPLVFSNETTLHHALMLSNMATMINKIENPRIQHHVDNDVLELFSFALHWRQDVKNHPMFPWDSAVKYAITSAEPDTHSLFSMRFNILTEAPKQLVQKHIRQEYLKHEKPFSFLQRFRQEMPLGTNDYLGNIKFYEFIANMPKQNERIAQDVISLALHITSLAHARWEYRFETPHNVIPEEFLHMIWDAAESQWDALRPKDKETTLAGIHIILADELWTKAQTTLKDTPLARSYRLIHAMMDALSEDGKEKIVRDYARTLKAFSGLEVPAILTNRFPNIETDIYSFIE